MPLYEKASALVIRTADWSESSRIATLFTREYGKIRALAKGGRNLRSDFEVGLDLLNLCSIVFIRKSHGSLDLLTQALVEEGFPNLRTHLPTLYAAYYVAELLGDGVQDHDPHPVLYDAALATLRRLNTPGADVVGVTMAFELAWFCELGYRPRLAECAVCGSAELLEKAARVSFSPAAGGAVCPACEIGQRDRRGMTRPALEALRRLAEQPGAEAPPGLAVRGELRELLGYSVSCILGRRPKLLGFIG